MGLPGQVGNPEARDAAKHSAVFVLRSALAAVVPTAGVMVSAHYDKRGAKIAIQYAGEDCSAMKDRVQEECTKICKHRSSWQLVQRWCKLAAVVSWCTIAVSDVAWRTLQVSWPLRWTR